MVLFCCAGHSGCSTPDVICEEGESRSGAAAICAPFHPCGMAPREAELCPVPSMGAWLPVPCSIHRCMAPSAPFHPWVRGSQCPVPAMGAWLPERQSCVPRAGTSLPTGEDTLFILFLTCPKQRRLFWILKEFCGKTAGCVVLREAAVRDVCAELCREQAALLQILPCLC